MKTLPSRVRPVFSFRRWQFLVGILACLGVASFLLWKDYSAPPYCKVTVVSIRVDKKGHGTFEAKTLYSSNATYWFTYIVDGETALELPLSSLGTPRSWTFLRPPIPGNFRNEFDMEADPDHGLPFAKKVSEAMNVKVGETYEVTPDTPLLVFRYKRYKGKESNSFEGWIKVSKYKKEDLYPIERIPSSDHEKTKQPLGAEGPDS